MPYTWTAPQDRHRTLKLWPHRSLPRRGMAAFILATFVMILMPLFAVIGTAVLWGLLPFLMAAVGAVWWGLERSYRDGNILEELTMDPGHIHLTRTNPKGDRQEWDCNCYWARAELHPQGGPVPNYVTLTGNGRTVEIGAFLSEDERKDLFNELCEALRLYKSEAPA
ncbi:MAG: DUF2244 domain-containing protein [Rhodobacterales bacterium]|nr:DUF2244 domain-containing protein [Rhodobacterales bacterium]MDX5388763.1 DUF2244 domain-containing protein [Rhodobacterales bacterium]MDX5488452.1 DUF2244 domain-containing protein [Rhodobacterales bacterium]